MNATPHTPGPWIIDGGAWTPPTQHIIRAKAAYCDAWIPIAHCYEPEAAANCRLIAAAPEMLAALQAIHAALNQPVQFTGLRTPASTDVLRLDARLAREVALAAIAKATGGVQ